MEQKYCYSCGLPMGYTEDKATNGKNNPRLCNECVKSNNFNGDFTLPGMVEFSVPELSDLRSGMSD